MKTQNPDKKLFIEFLQLSKRLFWDMDTKKLDPEKSKRIIIERVLSRGDLDDIRLLFKYYGKELIKAEVTEVGYWDKKTMNWLSLILEIPLKKFKCYTKKQLTPTHWN